jgi:hypothetical protein
MEVVVLMTNRPWRSANGAECSTGLPFNRLKIDVKSESKYDNFIRMDKSPLQIAGVGR